MASTQALDFFNEAVPGTALEAGTPDVGPSWSVSQSAKLTITAGDLSQTVAYAPDNIYAIVNTGVDSALCVVNFTTPASGDWAFFVLFRSNSAHSNWLGLRLGNDTAGSDGNGKYLLDQTFAYIQGITPTNFALNHSTTYKIELTLTSGNVLTIKINGTTVLSRSSIAKTGQNYWGLVSYLDTGTYTVPVVFHDFRVSSTNWVELTGSSSDTVTFAESLSVTQGLEPKATDTLVFVETARGFNGKKLVGDSIAYSELVESLRVYNRTATDTLLFIDSAAGTRINRASDSITLSDAATAESTKGVNDELVFSETVVSAYTPHYDVTGDSLVIAETLVGSSVLVRSVTDTVTFAETAVFIRARFASADDLFTITDNAQPTRVTKPEDTLTFGEDIVANRTINQFVTDALDLVDTVSRSVVYNLSTNDSVVYQDIYMKPVQISGNEEQVVIPIPSVIVTLVTNKIVLQTTQRALVLRRPLLGDAEGGLSKLIMQTTITGGRFTYVRNTDTRKLKYSFILDRNKALETRRFIIDFLSTPMTLTNFKGEIWYGYLIANPTQLRVNGRSSPCGESYAVDVEFEGARIH